MMLSPDQRPSNMDEAVEEVADRPLLYACSAAPRSCPIRERVLFPLERHHALSSPAAVSLGKGAKASLARDVDEALWGLNYLHGESARSEAKSLNEWSAYRSRRIQASVWSRVEDAALQALDHDGAQGPEGCLKHLLRGRSVYDSAPSSSVAPFESGRVALPTSLHGCPQLSSLLPAADRNLLEGFEQRLLRDPSEVESLIRDHGEPIVYMDATLGRSRKQYKQFVQECFEIGLVSYTTDCRSQLGIFFVSKKDGSLRLILDCRRTNLLFKDPPKTELIKGEGLAQFEVEGGRRRASGIGRFLFGVWFVRCL